MTGEQTSVARKVSSILQLPVQWPIPLFDHTPPTDDSKWCPGGYREYAHLKACPRGLDFRSLPRGGGGGGRVEQNKSLFRARACTSLSRGGGGGGGGGGVSRYNKLVRDGLIYSEWHAPTDMDTGTHAHTHSHIHTVGRSPTFAYWRQVGYQAYTLAIITLYTCICTYSPHTLSDGRWVQIP